ncbi:MAG: hypothetical protein ABI921_00045 [Panacibacter sp.]
MIKKISRERCYGLYPKFPSTFAISDQFTYPDLYKSYILTVESKSAKSHAKNIAAALQHFIESMSIPSLIFLGDTTAAWLSQENDYAPVKDAMHFLESEKVGKKFNGGLQVATDGLTTFIPHLFWLVRCNAALPIFYLMNEDQTILANFCQYGNIHISTLTKKADALFNKNLPQSGLQFFEGAYCSESFAKTAKIKGRGLTI